MALTDEQVQALANLTVIYPGAASYSDEDTEAHRIFGGLVQSGHVEAVEIKEPEHATCYRLSEKYAEANRQLIAKHAEDAESN